MSLFVGHNLTFIQELNSTIWMILAMFRLLLDGPHRYCNKGLPIGWTGIKAHLAIENSGIWDRLYEATLSLTQPGLCHWYEDHDSLNPSHGGFGVTC